MGRNALLIGGVVVAGAIIALLLALKKDDSRRTDRAPPTTATTPSTPSTSMSASPSTSPSMTPPSVGGSDSTGVSASGVPTPGSPGGPPPVGAASDPRTPVVTDTPEPRSPSTGSATQYTVGTLGIRDHRGSNAVTVDVPPNVHAPGETLIDSALTNEIGQKVRAVIYACAREAGREGRGATPRLEGQFAIDVHAHELKVVSATFQARDVAEAPAAQIKSCVEGKVVGLTIPAPQQDDIESYGINVTLRLP